MKFFYFKEKPATHLRHGGKTTKKHMFQEKKTRENERKWKKNIYKMLNAWLRNCRNMLAFGGDKAYKERGRKEDAWRAVEQFLIVFLSTIKNSFFFITFAKKFLMHIT